MEKPAIVDFPVHEIIARRWSPRMFSDKRVPAETIRSLLEAARWAASCFNEQPWAFLIASVDQAEEHERMAACLVDANRAWAEKAPLLMISVAALQFARNGKPNRHAYHDVGQAVAGLTFQAMAQGLFVHQMAGIHADRIREEYALPEGYEPVAGIAVGYPWQAGSPPEDLAAREAAPRSRKTQDAFVFSKSWGQSF